MAHQDLVVDYDAVLHFSSGVAIGIERFGPLLFSLDWFLLFDSDLQTYREMINKGKAREAVLFLKLLKRNKV